MTRRMTDGQVRGDVTGAIIAEAAGGATLHPGVCMAGFLASPDRWRHRAEAAAGSTLRA
jgi:hypothetical protein